MKRREFMQRITVGMAGAMLSANLLLGQRQQRLEVVEVKPNRIAEELAAGEKWLSDALDGYYADMRGQPITEEQLMEAVEVIRAAPSYPPRAYYFQGNVADWETTVAAVQKAFRPNLFQRIVGRLFA